MRVAQSSKTPRWQTHLRSRRRAKLIQRLPAPARPDVRTASRCARQLGLAPDNPRIKLVQAMCAPNTAADPAAVDRWRAVVASFEAAPPSRPGKPDWGHVEALTMLGETYLQRGDPVAGARCTRARIGTRAGLSAGAATSAGCLVQAALNYTVHVNRRQLPSFMSPQLQLFDARSAG